MNASSRWDDVEAGALVRVRGRQGVYKFMQVFRSPREVSLTLYGPVRKDGLSHEGRQAYVNVLPNLVSHLPGRRRRARSTK